MIIPGQRLPIVIATRPVDFRRGHEGLAATVQNELGLVPHSGLVRDHGAGHEEKAVRTPHDLLEPLAIVLGQAQVLDADSVGDANDRRLAVDGRQDADAKVEVLALEDHFDSAVLRLRALGYVDVRLSLGTPQERSQEPLDAAVLRLRALGIGNVRHELDTR